MGLIVRNIAIELNLFRDRLRKNVSGRFAILLVHLQTHTSQQIGPDPLQADGVLIT